MMIVAGERNISRAGDAAGKESPLEIEDLQPVLGEKELGGDLVEGQHLVDEGVIKPGRGIDIHLEMGLLPTGKLDDAVRGHVWRAMESVGYNVLPEMRVDPH